jgi:hypothetical protein
MKVSAPLSMVPKSSDFWGLQNIHEQPMVFAAMSQGEKNEKDTSSASSTPALLQSAQGDTHFNK